MRVRVSAVFEQANEILCMKYVYGGKDVFALPGGGVDRDVPLQEAVISEWKNELGVKVEVGNIILVGEAPGTKRHPQTLHIIIFRHSGPRHPESQTRSYPLPGYRLGPCNQTEGLPFVPRCGQTAL